MRLFSNRDGFSEEVKQLIFHGSRDMNRFYTLSTEERQEVLNRIHAINTHSVLEATPQRNQKT